jgi:hypothetical protein
MAAYRGVLHVHSTWSDGLLSPEELKTRARAEGLDYLVLCEHSSYLGPKALDEAIAHCADLSDKAFLLMLGLEVEREGRHVLVLAPPDLLKDAAEVNAGQHPGVLTIWAHPAITYDWTLRPGRSAPCDGWEVWNRRIDGNAPNAVVSRLLRSRRLEEKPVLAFGGSDFHKPGDVLEPAVEVDLPALGSAELHQALRQGAYRVAPACSAGSAGSIAHHVLLRCRCLAALTAWHTRQLLRLS